MGDRQLAVDPRCL